MERSRSGATAIAVALVLLAGCSQEQPPPAARPSPSTADTSPPDPRPTPLSRCANQDEAISSGQAVGGEASGDVDGDGSDDLVYLVREDEGPPGCQTFLVAETAAGSLATPTGEADVSYSLQAPRINSLVQVDDSAGLEILVDLEQGASTQFLGMFKATAAGLEKVRILGGSAYGDLFPYGGSVGHIEASNCTDKAGADVLIAMATPNAIDYTIRTVLYQMKGASLRPLPLHEQPPIATGADVELSDGFDSSPFGDCPTSS